MRGDSMRIWGWTKTLGKLFGLVVVAAAGLVLFWTATTTQAPPEVEQVDLAELSKDKPETCTRPPSEIPFDTRNAILSVETGGHTDNIRALAVSPANGLLYSASHDKTIRVWQDGTLVQTIRLPRWNIGIGGSIDAIAFSPNGSLLAAGGATGLTREATDLYLLDPETGKIVHTLPGRPESINKLAFSPDGKYLAVGLAGCQGIRIWSTDDWSQPVREDRNFQGAVIDMTFDPAGNLYVSSGKAAPDLKTMLRKYTMPAGNTSNALGLIPTKTIFITGRNPWGLDVSPDGKTLAVGDGKSKQVLLFDTTTLSLARAAPQPSHLQDFIGRDTNGFWIWKTNALSSVAWSRDGNTLFAAGSFRDSADRYMVRSWSGTTLSEIEDHVLGHARIYAMTQHGQDGVIVADGDGQIDRRDQDSWKVLVKPSKFLLSRQSADLLASLSGRAIAFNTPEAPQTYLRFDLDQRSVTTRSLEGVRGLVPARSKSVQGTRISGYNNYDGPILDGQYLTWWGKVRDQTLSAAHSVDGLAIALGGRSNLYLISSDGEKIWQTRIASRAEQVLITEDNKLVIAAFGNGTINWFSRDTGRLILSLFIQPSSSGETQAKDQHTMSYPWIAWTPHGDFDASANGEGLAGWHLNRGSDRTGLFFSQAQYRKQFYKPNLIANVLNTWQDTSPDVSSYVAKFQLPEITIVETTRDLGSTGDARGQKITLRYQISNPLNIAIKKIEIMVDGTRLATAENLDGSVERDAIRSTSFRMFPGELNFQLIARPGPDAPFGSSQAMVSRGDAQPRGRPRRRGIAPERGKPNLHALLIGISFYEHLEQKNQLRFADDDARDLALLLDDQAGNFFGTVNTTVLTGTSDTPATAANIDKALNDLAEAANDQDYSIVFLAGHGKTYFEERQAQSGIPTGTYNYLASDYKSPTEPALKIDGARIHKFLRESKGKRIILLDTCHSGQTDNAGLLNTLKGTGAIIFASSTGTQLSHERDDWGHGAFTKALLDGVRQGKIEGGNPDGFINHHELANWLYQEVTKLTENAQTPVQGHSGLVVPTKILATPIREDLMATTTP